MKQHFKFKSKFKNRGFNVCSIFGFFFLLLGGYVPYGQASSDEHEFKATCRPLIIAYLKLGVGSGHIDKAEFASIMEKNPDISEKDLALDTNFETVIADTVKNLKTFLKKYPDSPWADDAQVVIASASNVTPHDAYFAWQAVLEKYPNGSVDDWTWSNIIIIPEILRGNILQDVAALMIGHAQFKLGKYESAIDTYQIITERYAHSPLRELPNIARSAHFSTVYCYDKLGQSDNALNYLEDLMDHYPDSKMVVDAARFKEMIQSGVGLNQMIDTMKEKMLPDGQDEKTKL